MARKSNTRAAQGLGSIRQRSDGRWEGRFSTRNPLTGETRAHSVYGKTQKEVRQKLTETIAAIDRGDYREPCRMTLAEWLDIWSRDYLGGVKPTTAFQYREQIRLHIVPALGKVRLEALNPHTVQRFYNTLSKPHGDKKGLSQATIKQIHSILRNSLQQAVRVGYLRTNPASGCTLPRPDAEEVPAFDVEQVQAFLKQIEGNRYETLFKVALFTGMRLGELLGLEWSAVDFDAGTVAVRQQLQRERVKDGNFFMETPKNGKPRTLTPAPVVMELLQEHRVRQIEQRFRLAGAWEDLDLVFTNSGGGYCRRYSDYVAFKRVVKKIGMPDAHFHSLRHSYAVMAVMAGDDIKTLQTALGHSSPTLALNTYLTVTKEMQRESAERMETFITERIS